MGAITDARISDWQEEHGIKPATGQYAQALNDLSKFGYELIQIVELERSGIRGGDGCWAGSDPISGLCRDGKQLLDRVKAKSREPWLPVEPVEIPF